MYVVTHIDRGPLGHSSGICYHCECTCCKHAMHNCVIRLAWCYACTLLSQPQAGPNAQSRLHVAVHSLGHTL